MILPVLLHRYYVFVTFAQSSCLARSGSGLRWFGNGQRRTFFGRRSVEASGAGGIWTAFTRYVNAHHSGYAYIIAFGL